MLLSFLSIHVSLDPCDSKLLGSRSNFLYLERDCSILLDTSLSKKTKPWNWKRWNSSILSWHLMIDCQDSLESQETLPLRASRPFITDYYVTLFVPILSFPPFIHSFLDIPSSKYWQISQAWPTEQKPTKPTTRWPAPPTGRRLCAVGTNQRTQTKTWISMVRILRWLFRISPKTCTVGLLCLALSAWSLRNFHFV